MQKFTLEQAIIISGYTGILACDFSHLHEDIEKRMRRPVFTHEFPSLREEIKELYKEDFLDLCIGE